MKLDDVRAEMRAMDDKAAAAWTVEGAARSALVKAGGAITRLRAALVATLVMNALLVAAFARFTAAHHGELRFAVPGAVLFAATGAQVVAGAKQIWRLGALDFAEKVTVLQRKAAELRRARIEAVRWTFFLAPLLWVPLLVVSFAALFDVDVYAALPAAWFVANVVFGLAFAVAASAAASWVEARFGDRPLVRRLARDLTGANLVAVEDLLRELGEPRGA